MHIQVDCGWFDLAVDILSLVSPTLWNTLFFLTISRPLILLPRGSWHRLRQRCAQGRGCMRRGIARFLCGPRCCGDPEQGSTAGGGHGGSNLGDASSAPKSQQMQADPGQQQQQQPQQQPGTVLESSTTAAAGSTIQPSRHDSSAAIACPSCWRSAGTRLPPTDCPTGCCRCQAGCPHGSEGASACVLLALAATGSDHCARLSGKHGICR